MLFWSGVLSYSIAVHLHQALHGVFVWIFFWHFRSSAFLFPFFFRLSRPLLMRLTIYRHFECFGLHALLECVSSRHVHKKMIGHNIHISYLCGLHELNGCVSSNTIHKKTICSGTKIPKEFKNVFSRFVDSTASKWPPFFILSDFCSAAAG